MGNLTTAEAARFASKTQRANDCLLWTGPLDRDGYGGFWLRGATRRAHRVAWFDANGEVADGFVVNHTCRQRSCVNPQHLHLVTVQENAMKDSSSPAYVNSQKTTCPKGHEYDGVEMSHGRQIRVCKTCRREQARVAAKRRYAAARSSLKV